jgi:hypothetical protein
LKALSSYDNIGDKLLGKDSSANFRNEEEEDEPDYMRIKEIFSFENIARIHREIEQLKDVVREMRGHTIP